MNEVFLLENVNTFNPLNFDDLLKKLGNVEQKSVIIIGNYRDEFIEGFANKHAFNARRLSDGNWEIIDVQNGAKYTKKYVDDKFNSLRVYEVLNKEYTDIAKNKLKLDFPEKGHLWIDKMTGNFLDYIDQFFNKEYLKELAKEYNYDFDKLSEFTKDPLLLEVWKTFKNTPGIDIKLRLDINQLKKAKLIVCKARL
ncbi:hypothetical protein [Tenacibaculum sp. nBUS_03]|uniref:hypothetical protein n=1 Tax=Tenacibaculum sp. nBUS_03 TaxID=3395320 RepID=UPI003EBDBA9A